MSHASCKCGARGQQSERVTAARSSASPFTDTRRYGFLKSSPGLKRALLPWRLQKVSEQIPTTKSFGDYETEGEQEAYREGWQQATEEREALRALLREAGAATAWMPDGWKQRAKELGV